MSDRRPPPEPTVATAEAGLPVLPPLAAYLEILVLLVLPAALDHFVPAFPSLPEIQPHPFWLPILLLSLQYGTVSGLLAAGIAIALNAILGWPEQEVGENHFAYLLRIWAQPVLWIGAALVLGQFRLRQIEQKQRLTQQLAELMTQRNAISNHSTHLRDRCEKLERALAQRLEPGNRDLLVALGQLGSHDPAASATAFGRAASLAFGPCQASMYARDMTGLHLVEKHGWPVGTTRRIAFRPDEPLFKAVVQEGRPLSVLNPGDEAELGADGLVAVPILSGDSARVIGLLKLEAIAPAALDAATPARLSAIAAHAAIQLEQRTNVGHAPRTIPPHGQHAATRPRVWRQIKSRPSGAPSAIAERKPGQAS